MTDYKVLAPFTAGRPLRMTSAGETVRGIDLDGWNVLEEEVKALIARGKLEVKGDPDTELGEQHYEPAEPVAETVLPAPEPNHDEQP